MYIVYSTTVYFSDYFIAKRVVYLELVVEHDDDDDNDD